MTRENIRRTAIAKVGFAVDLGDRCYPTAMAAFVILIKIG
jgi:hypothetical protein